MEGYQSFNPVPYGIGRNQRGHVQKACTFKGVTASTRCLCSRQIAGGHSRLERCLKSGWVKTDVARGEACGSHS